jgi:L-ascorbate metabolism protein UlaG (beta-lactamase superfamily)
VKVASKRPKGRRGLRIAAGVLAALLLVGAVLLADSWRGLGKRAEGERLQRMQASPAWNGERFRNAIPTGEMSSWALTKRWLKGADFTSPTEPPPTVTPTGLGTPPASGLRITWFGHSSLLVEIDGKRFLTDPVWSERCSPSSVIGPKRFFEPPLPLDELPPVDAVLLSHDHYDHLDEPSIRLLNQRVPAFVVPLGIGAHLQYWGVPAAKIRELDWWGQTRVGEIELTATPARHFSGRWLGDADKTLWAGWSLRGPRHRVYYSGDTAMFPGFKEIGARLGPFDATLIEVGAYDRMWADVHLGPEQAVQAHRDVQGKLMLPVHWGTFNLALHAWTEPVERLLVAAARASVNVVVPRPGESIEPSNPPPPAPWWPKVPWHTAAEHPVVSSGLRVTQP